MKKQANVGVLGLVVSGLLAAAPARGETPPSDTPEVRLMPAASGGLTADQVASRAEQTSFSAAAQQKAIAAATARLDQAKVAYLPKLTLSGSYTRLSEITQPTFYVPNASGGGSPVQIQVPLDRYLLQASLTIPLTDYVLRLSHNYAVASRNQRAATLDEQAARLKSSTDGRLAYYAWLRAKGQLNVATRALAQAKAHLDDAHNAFDVGTSSKADVLRVESQLASAELVVAQAQNVVDLNEDQIRTAMHDPGQNRYEVGEDLSADLAPLPAAGSIESLRDEAMNKRLEVRALDETAWSLREQASAARASYYPRLDVFGNAIYANPNPRLFFPSTEFRASWEAGVQLTWTPNDALNAKSVGADAEARASQTEMQKQVLRDSVRMEVMQAHNSLREAEVALGTTTRGLRAAEEGYRVRRELFRNGRATSVELTDAEVELFRAGLDAVNARANLRSARASLLHAVGRDVPANAAAGAK